MSAAWPAPGASLARWLDDRPAVDRALALAGAAVLTGAHLAVLYHVVDVVGGPGGLELFAFEVVAAMALALAVGATLRLRYALLLGAALLVAGLGAYLLAIPGGGLAVERQLRDTVALLSGLSVLRMTKAGVWALGFTPGPLFVSTYLFLRRRYALGVLVGGAALAFFISTGDVDVIHGLVGVLGAVAALGFGRLDHEDGTSAQRDAVVVLLVAILVVTTSVSLVPGGEARPLLPGSGGGSTVESSLVTAGDSVAVRGSTSLSPEVRYTVTAEAPARWRVGAFDRYSGRGWVRSGQSRAYDGSLPYPAGNEIRRLRQTFRVESSSTVMPAAWKPTRVVDGADRTRVTSMGSLQPAVTLRPGDRYSVESHRDNPSALELRASGDDYPEEVVERYTQLPESTPERVGEFTSQLTARATNPYDTARVVEQWLEANKQYSLDVEQPDGDVAAGFIFQMDRGYCVYYATAMVAMLRSQGIPARFVVGYTAGERVTENQWVVRGLDSHAWVEVYFPHNGWVAFDPTPAGPRQAAEGSALDQARASGESDVDTDLTGGPIATPNSSDDDVGVSPGAPADIEGAEGDPTAGGTPTVPRGLLDGGGAGDAGDGPGDGLPDEQTVLYGLILLAGAATAAHRTGLFERGRRFVWLRRNPGGPPRRRVEATFARLDYLLARRYRPRRPDETPRAYLRAIRSRFTAGRDGVAYGVPTPGADSGAARAGPYGGRLVHLFELYERAHYAGRVTEAEADRAWGMLCELREEWSPWS